MDELSQEIKLFASAVHNLLPDEVIPQDAASDELGWFTQFGRIKLIGGRIPVGGTEGLTGSCTGEIFGYKVDGTTIHWVKLGSVIGYYDSAEVFHSVITGLTATADYAFSNYSSLAGTFTHAFGVDGIYKMNNATPGSYCAMYDSAKNFKGRAFIDKGRTILWNRMEDQTGLYGSWIDNQRAVSGATGVYTAVSGEATTSLTGTLAFKADGATRNCFGVTITLTGTGEVFTDHYLGILTGSLGGTGTINYITGAYTLSVAGTGTAAYQWEDSNVRGVTDFTHSATRAAGEGFQFPQDIGGDAILNVLIGPDQAYYSAKSKSFYRLAISDDDTTADNNVYRQDIGIASWRSVISTQLGIVFINVANPERPQFTILERNPIGNDVIPRILFKQFDFSLFGFDDAVIDTYDQFFVVGCASSTSGFNNRILLCQLDGKAQKVDISPYTARTFAKDAGILYCGSPVTKTVYKLFNGFDDGGLAIDNFWRSKGELFQGNRSGSFLKKSRRLRLGGLISQGQSYAVYLDYDNSGPQLIGTVLGTGSYVDYTSPQSVGSNTVGTSQVGGNDVVEAYPYLMEIRIKKPPKWRKRAVIFIALGIGYVDIDYLNDWGINFFEDKLPSRFRQKQNVNLAGTETNLPHPEF